MEPKVEKGKFIFSDWDIHLLLPSELLCLSLRPEFILLTVHLFLQSYVQVFRFQLNHNFPGSPTFGWKIMWHLGFHSPTNAYNKSYLLFISTYIGSVSLENPNTSAYVEKWNLQIVRIHPLFKYWILLNVIFSESIAKWSGNVPFSQKKKHSTIRLSCR